MSINQHSFKPLPNGRIKMEACFLDLSCWCLITMNLQHLTHLFTSAMVAWASQHLNPWLLTRYVSLIFAIAGMIDSLSTSNTSMGRIWDFDANGHKGPVLGMKWAMRHLHMSWLSSLQSGHHCQQLWKTMASNVQYMLWWPMRICVILSLLLARLFQNITSRSNYQPSSERNDEPCSVEPLHLLLKGLDLIEMGARKPVVSKQTWMSNCIHEH